MLLRITFDGYFGYEKVTFSNLISPLKLSSILPFYGFLINGYLSRMAYILEAASNPYPIFFKAGES